MRIFISYRRIDTKLVVGRLYDRLAHEFESKTIFVDIDNIPIGDDFRRVVRNAVEQSDVILVIIGDQWLDARDEYQNRRLDNPDDLVRIEVETSLSHPDKLVIPVLVENAPMPSPTVLPESMKELSFKNALPLRHDPDFHRDVTRLIERIRQRRDEKAGLQPEIIAPSAPTPEPQVDIHDAIAQFYKFMGESNWQGARQRLDIIKNAKDVPRFLNLAQMEAELSKQESQASYEKQAQSEYEVLRLMARYESDEKVRDAFNMFVETYPDYDPDDFASKYGLYGYDIYIDDPGAKKINMIKEIRLHTDAGLIEAKEAIESGAPFLLKSGVDFEESRVIKAAFEQHGATVRLEKSRSGIANITNAPPVFYTVYIDRVGENKINLIKILREFRALSLQDGRTLILSPTPILALRDASKTVSESIKKMMEEEGAIVRIEAQS